MPSAMAPLDTITTSRPCARQRGELAAPVADRLGVDAAAFVRDQAGADLDDDAARVLQHDAQPSAASSLGAEIERSDSTGAGVRAAATCS